MTDLAGQPDWAAKLKALADKATAGPWEAETPAVNAGYCRILGAIDRDAYDDGTPRPLYTHVADVIDNSEEQENLAFIAACREGVPKLCAELDRLRATNAALVRALTKYVTNEHHRMAEGGGTIVTGYSCDLCGAEATFLKELAHKPTCALTPTPAPQERQNG